MMPRERLEAIESVLNEMDELPEDWVIVVEGLRDRKALETLGLHREMIMVQSEGGPLRISEHLYRNDLKAVILTDWDDKGEKIAMELKRNLSSLCVPFDLTARTRLKDLSIKDIKDVESLDSLWDRLTVESWKS